MLRVTWKTPSTKKSFIWDGQPIILGRDESCDIVFDDSSLSRRHLRMEYDVIEQKVHFSDLNSANGTWYKHEKIEDIFQKPPVLLRLGSSSYVRVVSIKQQQKKKVFGIFLLVCIAFVSLFYLKRVPTQKQAKMPYLLKQPQSRLPELPKLETSAMEYWAKEKIHDSGFQPGAMGLALRALRSLIESNENATGLQQVFGDAQKDYQKLIQQLEYDAIRSMQLHKYQQAQFAAQRLYEETRTIDLEKANYALSVLKDAQARMGQVYE